jgi:hypothetical protein
LSLNNGGAETPLRSKAVLEGSVLSGCDQALGITLLLPWGTVASPQLLHQLFQAL